MSAFRGSLTACCLGLVLAIGAIRCVTLERDLEMMSSVSSRTLPMMQITGTAQVDAATGGLEKEEDAIEAISLPGAWTISAPKGYTGAQSILRAGAGTIGPP